MLEHPAAQVFLELLADILRLRAVLFIAAVIALIDRLWRTERSALWLFAALLRISVFVRPWLLRHVRTD